MEAKKLVTITNKIALWSVGLMAYWVFIFVSITIFDFKIFRENITQAFYLSIVGVFALLGGAIIVNVMLNMTRISNSLEIMEGAPAKQKEKVHKKWLFIVGATFPLIFALLFMGDYRSSMKKRNDLIDTAKAITIEHSNSIKTLSRYSFSNEYIENTSRILKVLTKIEKKIPNIRVIVQDSIEQKTVLLAFSKRHRAAIKKKHKKENFIFPTSREEREYINSVFNKGVKEYKFSANDGNYELYFPVIVNNSIIVMYFTDRNKYGKYGS